MSDSIHASSTGAGPDVILLHGLFGMGSNLGSLARALAPDFRVHSLDLPNHGRSAWLESMTLETLAAAVASWMERHTPDGAALVGHSLGGKVAMRLALDAPASVRGLVVADIAPVHYPARHDAVLAALVAVSEAAPASRAAAGEVMRDYLEDEGVRQFLLLSLYRGDDGGYRWRFNLDGLRRDYDAVREGLSSDSPYRGPALFIKGEQSDYIQPRHREAILGLFPQAEVRVLQDCGHWLHAEQPRLFNAVVGRFLRSLDSGGQQGEQ